MLLIFGTVESEEDRALLIEIFRSYYGLIKKIAMDILHSNSDAEDVVQDTMEILMMDPSKYRNLYSPKVTAGISLIARNRSIDIYRRNKRAAEMFEALDWDIPDFSVPENSGVELLDALARIKPRYRDLLYFKVQGYSVAEIAKITGSTESAVQQAVNRARAALKKELERED